MNWMKVRSLLTFAAAFTAVVLLAGCFSDPNPKKRFAFAGEQPGSTERVQLASNAPLVPAVGSSGIDFTRLRIGELLTVTFSDIPPPGIPPQTSRIPQDGMITLPYNVRVKAAGRTVPELQDDIRNAYVPSLFVNLTATIKAEDRVVYVGGEVKVPQRLLYLGDLTVARAIDTAGGFTDFANRKKIELRRANGETHMVNWFKVRKDPKLDLPVFPNDQITVPRASF
jgi:polysaccharide export outer membrane protein